MPFARLFLEIQGYCTVTKNYLFFGVHIVPALGFKDVARILTRQLFGHLLYTRGPPGNA